MQGRDVSRAAICRHSKKLHFFLAVVALAVMSFTDVKCHLKMTIDP